MAHRPIPLSCGAMIAALLGAQATAQGYFCTGTQPSWTLAFDTAQATFDFPAPTSMDVMHATAAEGREWPQAFTLIGDRDTAIVLLERRSCGPADHEVRIFTQRGQSPILLSGCCVADGE